MNIQKKLKICLNVIGKQSLHNCVKFDFCNNIIEATDGKILLRINTDFSTSVYGTGYESFKDRGSFFLNANILNVLIGYLDNKEDIFEIIEKNPDFFEYKGHFPDTDGVRLTNTRAVERITYNTKNILRVITICNQLKMDYINFYFNGDKGITEIKNEIGSLVFLTD